VFFKKIGVYLPFTKPHFPCLLVMARGRGMKE